MEVLGSARRYLVGSSEAAVEHGVEELWWAIVFLQIIAGWVFFRAADRLPPNGAEGLPAPAASA